MLPLSRLYVSSAEKVEKLFEMIDRSQVWVKAKVSRKGTKHKSPFAKQRQVRPSHNSTLNTAQYSSKAHYQPTHTTLNTAQKHTHQTTHTALNIAQKATLTRSPTHKAINTVNYQTTYTTPTYLHLHKLSYLLSWIELTTSGRDRALHAL